MDTVTAIPFHVDANDKQVLNNLDQEVTPKQLAVLLDKHPQTIYRAMKKKLFPFERLGPRGHIKINVAVARQRMQVGIPV